MQSLLEHPWAKDPDFQSAWSTLRVELKSAEQLLDGDDPPAWIIFLDEWVAFGGWRSRLILDAFATLDLVSERSVKSRRISDSEFATLIAVLNNVTIEKIEGLQHEPVIDGHHCALTVIHGNPRWMAFVEFNLGGVAKGDRHPALRLTNEIIACREKA